MPGRPEQDHAWRCAAFPTDVEADTAFSKPLHCHVGECAHLNAWHHVKLQDCLGLKAALPCALLSSR